MQHKEHVVRVLFHSRHRHLNRPRGRIGLRGIHSQASHHPVVRINRAWTVKKEEAGGHWQRAHPEASPEQTRNKEHAMHNNNGEPDTLHEKRGRPSCTKGHSNGGGPLRMWLGT